MTSRVSHVRGFRWSGLHCGIKSDEKALDLGLLAADAPVPVAAVFTKNLVKAAPVVLGLERVRLGTCKAILVNSGNANACTGTRGLRAARKLTSRVAQLLGSPAEQIFPSSTGVIGVPLDENSIARALPRLVERLSPKGIDAFSRAILTTDRGPKVFARSFSVGRTKAKLLCVCKGAGMIHPNMATTLSFVVTDAPIARNVLRRSLRRAVATTFNAITVDGDTSTNDSVFLMTSGATGGSTIKAGERSASVFEDSLTDVLREAAASIVADGEGAEHFVEVRVEGAAKELDARRMAQTVATSTLVKTALFGCDPNWGRIMAALGRSGPSLDADKVSIWFGPAQVVRTGNPLGSAAERRAHRVMKQESYAIRIRVGGGPAHWSVTTSDLGYEYVRINAEYRS